MPTFQIFAGTSQNPQNLILAKFNPIKVSNVFKTRSYTKKWPFFYQVISANV